MTSPTPAEHLNQARANRNHAEWLVATSPNDPTALQWAVTATFYSALHALTAHLLVRHVRVWDHRMRSQAIADPINGVPASIRDDYRLLERRSRQTRYLLRRFGRQRVQELLDQELARIAAFTGM